MDKLEIFHANQTPICLEPHQNFLIGVIGVINQGTRLLINMVINKWDGWGLMLRLLSGSPSLNGGFLLLRHSVVCPVESLFLFYLLVIS